MPTYFPFLFRLTKPSQPAGNKLNGTLRRTHTLFYPDPWPNHSGETQLSKQEEEPSHGCFYKKKLGTVIFVSFVKEQISSFFIKSVWPKKSDCHLRRVLHVAVTDPHRNKFFEKSKFSKFIFFHFKFLKQKIIFQKVY
jgi:hypothetical protein